MDLLWIVLIATVLCTVAWVAYNVGRNTATRDYAASLANARQRERRLQAALDRGRDYRGGRA